MLSYNQEGNLCLEDLDGKVTLDVTNGVRATLLMVSDSIKLYSSGAYK